jgi:hypothetical protein
VLVVGAGRDRGQLGAAEMTRDYIALDTDTPIRDVAVRTVKVTGSTRLKRSKK